MKQIAYLAGASALALSFAAPAFAQSEFATGANVIAAIVLGLILAAIGVFLIWRRPSDER